MRTLFWTLLLLMPAVAYATRPGYEDSIAWVEKHGSTNNPVSKERLYVASVKGESPASAWILAYTNGISLRAVIDQTRYKDSDTEVMILRSEEGHRTVFVFDAWVKSAEVPALKLLPGDMIWLSKHPVPWK